MFFKVVVNFDRESLESTVRASNWRQALDMVKANLRRLGIAEESIQAVTVNPV